MAARARSRAGGEARRTCRRDRRGRWRRARGVPRSVPRVHTRGAARPPRAAGHDEAGAVHGGRALRRPIQAEIDVVHRRPRRRSGARCASTRASSLYAPWAPRSTGIRAAAYRSCAPGSRSSAWRALSRRRRRARVPFPAARGDLPTLGGRTASWSPWEPAAAVVADPSGRDQAPASWTPRRHSTRFHGRRDGRPSSRRCAVILGSGRRRPSDRGALAAVVPRGAPLRRRCRRSSAPCCLSSGGVRAGDDETARRRNARRAGDGDLADAAFPLARARRGRSPGASAPRRDI